jgi:hypothetical protein
MERIRSVIEVLVQRLELRLEVCRVCHEVFAPAPQNEPLVCPNPPQSERQEHAKEQGNHRNTAGCESCDACLG